MNNEPTQPDDDSTGSSELDREDFALDKALQLWGSERTAESSHLADQKSLATELLASQSIVESSSHARNSNDKLSQAPTFRLLGIPSWAWAVAATLLLAVGLSWAINRTAGTQVVVESQRGNLDANALTLVSTNLDQQRLLFSRFHEVFGNQIKSVSEVNGEVLVDLREEDNLLIEGGTGDSEYVSVRLVLISHDENSTGEKWAVVHDMNMLAGQERRIDIPMSEDGLEVSIWTFPVDDDLVSVDLDLKFKVPFEVGQVSSLLEKTGEPKQLFTTKRNGIEYRLYQTIYRIKADPRVGSNSTNTITAISGWEGCDEDV